MPEIGEAAADDSDSEVAETVEEHIEEIQTTSADGTTMDQTTVVAPEPHINTINTPLVEEVGASQQEIVDVPNLGRGHRPKLPSSRLRDYVVNTVSLDSSLSLSLCKITISTAVLRFVISDL